MWVDARAFDASLRRARGAIGQAAAEALSEAIELYTGPLLEDTGWGWVEPFRHTYSALANEAALRLSELLVSTDPSRSSALAEQVLAVDPDNIAAFERLVRNAESRRDLVDRDAILRRYPSLARRLGDRVRNGALRAI